MAAQGLLAHGGGSIKNNGIYDAVIEQLDQAGWQYGDFAQEGTLTP